MQLNQLLQLAGVDPTKTLVLRHAPNAKEFRTVFTALAREQPTMFNAYQRMQGEKVSRAMRRAQYVASFIALRDNRAVFVGLYEVKGYQCETLDKIMSYDGVKELTDLGMAVKRREYFWHDLEPTDLLAPFRFSLTVRWPEPAISWYRWAHKNTFEVLPSPIGPEVGTDMPDWRLLNLKWGQLKSMPPSWQASLKHWRGIYYIFDTSVRKGYVGSAYGKTNILGRWLEYAKTGHGGNVRLRRRNPKNFQFSILERVSPDMEQSDVVQLETTWKARLHTKEYGLNDN